MYFLLLVYKVYNDRLTCSKSSTTWDQQCSLCHDPQVRFPFHVRGEKTQIDKNCKSWLSSVSRLSLLSCTSNCKSNSGANAVELSLSHEMLFTLVARCRIQLNPIINLFSPFYCPALNYPLNYTHNPTARPPCGVIHASFPPYIVPHVYSAPPSKKKQSKFQYISF